MSQVEQPDQITVEGLRVRHTRATPGWPQRGESASTIINVLEQGLINFDYLIGDAETGQAAQVVVKTGYNKDILTDELYALPLSKLDFHTGGLDAEGQTVFSPEPVQIEVESSTGETGRLVVRVPDATTPDKNYTFEIVNGECFLAVDPDTEDGEGHKHLSSERQAIIVDQETKVTTDGGANKLIYENSPAHPRPQTQIIAEIHPKHVNKSAIALNKTRPHVGGKHIEEAIIVKGDFIQKITPLDGTTSTGVIEGAPYAVHSQDDTEGQFASRFDTRRMPNGWTETLLRTNSPAQNQAIKHTVTGVWVDQEQANTRISVVANVGEKPKEMLFAIDAASPRLQVRVPTHQAGVLKDLGIPESVVDRGAELASMAGKFNFTVQIDDTRTLHNLGADSPSDDVQLQKHLQFTLPDFFDARAFLSYPGESTPVGPGDVPLLQGPDHQLTATCEPKSGIVVLESKIPVPNTSGRHVNTLTIIQPHSQVGITIENAEGWPDGSNTQFTAGKEPLTAELTRICPAGSSKISVDPINADIE